MMIAEFSAYAHSDLNRPLEEECQILEEVQCSPFNRLISRRLLFQFKGEAHC